MKSLLSHKSYNVTSTVCMAYDLEVTEDQDVDASGVWLDTRGEKRERDGVGPQFVSGKSINEYFPVTIPSASLLQPGSSRE